MKTLCKRFAKIEPRTLEEQDTTDSAKLLCWEVSRGSITHSVGQERNQLVVISPRSAGTENRSAYRQRLWVGAIVRDGRCRSGRTIWGWLKYARWESQVMSSHPGLAGLCQKVKSIRHDHEHSSNCPFPMVVFWVLKLRMCVKDRKEPEGQRGNRRQ